jgi:hypothetical protein
MADAGILSAPVLDSVEGHPASNWLGFLDVSDIVTALLKGAPLLRCHRCFFCVRLR